MGIIRPNTEEAYEVKNAIPNQLIDDYEQAETFRSTAEATDETHIKVDVKEAQMFDMRADARNIAQSFQLSKEEIEIKEIQQKDFQHIATLSEQQQEAIVDMIAPEIVFKVMKKNHKDLDTARFNGGITETDESVTHEKAYDKLLEDMSNGRKEVADHLAKFHKFIGDI